MSMKIPFWTPVRYDNQPVSIGRKLGEYADAYLYLGGKIATVIPGTASKNGLGVQFQEEKLPCWQTALKVISYATLIIPVLAFIVKAICRNLYPFYESARILPNGTEEKGAFINGTLQQGVRIEKGETYFIRPKLLLGEVMVDGVEFNFAEVTLEGKQEIIPLQRPYDIHSFRNKEEYTRVKGSPYEALTKMAQDREPRGVWKGGLHYGSPIKFILNHPNNHLLTQKEFIDYIMTPDEKGQLPLHTINRDSLQDVIEIAKEMNVRLDLHAPNPVTGETLFSQWAGRGEVMLVRALLEIDPSAIRQTINREVSFVAQAILRGKAEEAALLLSAMKEQNIELSDTDRWIVKAFRNECSFTEEEFIHLPIHLKKQIYQIANVYIHKQLLQKLRELGMVEPPAEPERAAIISYNMDAIAVEETLRGFLMGLRKDGLLLTQEEFSKKERAVYYHKGDDVGRVLGRDYIERTAKRLGLGYVKVPKKTLVIKPENEGSAHIHFKVSRDGMMMILSEDLQVYAERITPIDRKATQTEMKGLIDLIIETGYNDFFGHNFFMGRNQSGEEGIYFIDTEFTNFPPLSEFNQIRRLKSLMAEKDHPWLESELMRRFKPIWDQENEKEKAIFDHWQTIKESFIEHGFAHRRKNFALPIADFIGAEALSKAANE